MSGFRLIAVEPPQKCQLCGTVSETRPYGPNGEEVCFACGMKDRRAAHRGFCRLVLGHDPTEEELESMMSANPVA